MYNRIAHPVIGPLASGCVAVTMLSATGPCLASDHGDTPLLIGAGRHEARVTDLYAFARDGQLVLAVCLDPTIPPEVTEYEFASDLRVKIAIDNDSDVTFDDPFDLATYGGTIVDPSRVQQDISIQVQFDTAGEPILLTTGLSAMQSEEIVMFAGLRDDPFIRGPRIGRNIAAIVFQMPLAHVIVDQSTLLIWATAAVEDLTGPFQDFAGRALRSQFPENNEMNSLAPKLHERFLGVPTDVMIYDTAFESAFPNGRELSDDVVDLVGDPRVLVNDAPFPDSNDVPFLDEFPYLAPPQ